MRSTLLSLGLAMSIPACVVTGASTIGVATEPSTVDVYAAPPAAKDEPVEARPGYVFLQGRWSWQHGQWVWAPGYWERERAGYAWTPGRWERQGPRWFWIEGSWTATGSSPPPPPPPPPSPQGVIAEGGSVAVGGGSGVIALALGENHTCSLSSAGEVRCWGYNKQGSLGVGTTRDPGDGIVAGIGAQGDGAVRAIVAGGYQTCALTSAGRVWCWGMNHAGQVGNGNASATAVSKPTRVDGLEDVRSLHAGDSTTCAIKRGGELYCWGDNSQHQIDDSSTKQVVSPKRVSGIARADLVAIGNYHLCVVSDGRVRCRGELGPLDRDLSSLTRVTAISAGWGHSCALQDGKASCWGKSYLGVLGGGPICAKNAACASALRAPALVPGIDGVATQLVGLDYHSCVLLQGGAVTCWGNNQGHAFSNTLPAEPEQTAHVLEGVTADVVYVGGVHTCTLRAGVAACRGNDWAGAVRGASSPR
ncbi:MAG: regulator of chromosome condensation [Deltaproteobacteria bacterium]|nr:regulator of chromosome condensation [Deltaproteobacteria bacterium]